MPTRAVLALFLALLLSACTPVVDVGSAPTPQPSKPSEWVTLIVHEDWLGAAWCGSRPTYWLNGETTKYDEGWVRRHETEHMAHMLEFPSCADFIKWWLADIAHRIAGEARAYCAGARWEFEHDRFDSMFEAVWKHAGGMARYFGITPADAAVEIFKFCTEP